MHSLTCGVTYGARFLCLRTDMFISDQFSVGGSHCCGHKDIKPILQNVLSDTHFPDYVLSLVCVFLYS